MAAHSVWWWYTAVCIFSIMGLMMSFYIVEKTYIPLYNRPYSKTPGKLANARTRQSASTARSTVTSTISPAVQTEQMREVILHCKMVCSKSAGDICVPLDLAVFVYKNDTPTENMTFNLQYHYPVVRVASASNASNESLVLEVERCNLEEHFPGVELIPRQPSCAVVGNSGILNNSSCGDFIDSHDFVIRANGALIKGYEVDVGKATSLSVINKTLLRKYGQYTNTTENLKIRAQFLDRIRTSNIRILWYPKHLYQPGTHCDDCGKYRSIVDGIRKNGFTGIRFAFSWKSIHVEKAWGLQRTATLGLDMYAVARTFCSNITLFGFYPFYKDLEGRAVKYHYFDDVKFNFSRNRRHSFTGEHTKLKELEKQRKLNLVVRDCKPREGSRHENTVREPIIDM
ncbi:CMP-N-acetylneuraminate-poly-alpha-2,8-sialyltransferase-like [Patiria miniata]|uniref:Uncharacterized protein n=1 Tax=Patiria miniata TaxID=46514 RepID=A0A914BSP7_PATMI|nr:CMP-N-acetylneuraminate-poly-alpha-2,8-sialyltransferase-like [Patiria miniata]